MNVPACPDAAPPDPEVVALTRGRAGVTVLYRPVLDVARGAAAGHQAVAGVRPADPAERIDPLAVVMTTIDVALHESATLPDDRFISIPVSHDLVGDPVVRARLLSHGDLGGLVLDVTDFASDASSRTTTALDDYREAGARIAVGSRDDAQPELGSILRLRPFIGPAGASGPASVARRTP
ncbi:hypothetical protein [Aeromicrobium fastidiosum]|uniref:EAL domain-containing protein n=1 Tax=Aeromicrobium fastidiosum TaxID=52699 RepID=A0A641ALA4_9ACTN|nr:hypothetical protein [Aeromicrobium fastidiosum]KAA1373724.1 hypothetical protein ESP62_017385 [Aeromicrobium fastidiosum]MBP2391288.1 hypothetical protein [Aeromicrobium fastidiosum]